jgi:Calcium binding
VRNTRRRRKGKTAFVRLSKARLDELVEEAIVDCYNESEQVTGLCTMIEDNLAVPFETTVLGVAVTVVRVQLTVRDEIVAVCRRAGTRQTVPLLDLPLPSPPPAGSEWIAAYRHWLRGG